ncbi:MAG: hypothetical protein Q8L48_39885 [Archangium sp.]|nr:hypothetical protein [Archangium sp.]
MRPALISFVLLSASACTSQDMCRSLAIGTSIEGMKRFEVTSASDPVFKAMVEPASTAMYGRGSGLVWDEGPAEAAMCCSAQESGFTRSWCTPEQLECTDPSLQGVKLYVLTEPYSDQSRVPADGTFCYVASQNGRIIAIFHRFWS